MYRSVGCLNRGKRMKEDDFFQRMVLMRYLALILGREVGVKDNDSILEMDVGTERDAAIVPDK